MFVVVRGGCGSLRVSLMRPSSILWDEGAATSREQTSFCLMKKQSMSVLCSSPTGSSPLLRRTDGGVASPRPLSPFLLSSSVPLSTLLYGSVYQTATSSFSSSSTFFSSSSTFFSSSPTFSSSSTFFSSTLVNRRFMGTQASFKLEDLDEEEPKSKESEELEALLKARKWEAAGQLFEQSRRQRRTDLRSHTLMLQSLVQRGELGRARALLEEMKAKKYGIEPNVVSFTIILKGLCNAKKLEQAQQLLEEMKRRGGNCKPNLISYTTLIAGFCKNGNMQRALHYFEELKKQTAPSSVTYNAVLAGWCKLPNMEQAQRFFEETRSQRPHLLNAVSYTTLISGWSRANHMDKAQQLFELMKSPDSPAPPDVVTFTIMLTGWSLQGDTAKAMALFQEMKSLPHIGVNSFTYNSLIAGLCEAGDMKTAHRFFSDMKKNAQFPPDVITYNHLISGWCQLQKMDHAHMLFKELKQLALQQSLTSSSSSSSTLSSSSTSSSSTSSSPSSTFKQQEEAKDDDDDEEDDDAKIQMKGPKNKIYEMKTSLLLRPRPVLDYNPNSVTYTTLMTAWCKQGNMTAAHQLFEEMKTSNACQPDAATFNTLISAWTKVGNIARCVELMNEMIKRQLPPDSQTLGPLMSWACRNNKPKDCWRIIEWGDRYGVVFNPYVEAKIEQLASLSGDSEFQHKWHLRKSKLRRQTSS